MKTNGSLGLLFRNRWLCAVAIISFSFAGANVLRAQNPDHGSVGPDGTAVTWQQTAPPNPGGGANTEAACVDGVNCEVFTLTVTGSKADWTNPSNPQRVKVRL